MKTLQEIGGNTVDEIQRLLSSEGVNATGDLSASVRYSIAEMEDKTSFRVYANSYIDDALQGTPPGSDFEILYQNLKRWVMLGKYGIDPNSKTAAYFIARRIVGDGSKKYREPELAKSGVTRFNLIVKDTVTEVTASAIGIERTKIINILKTSANA
jgi:hypothetical protein